MLDGRKSSLVSCRTSWITASSSCPTASGLGSACSISLIFRSRPLTFSVSLKSFPASKVSDFAKRISPAAYSCYPGELRANRAFNSSTYRMSSLNSVKLRYPFLSRSSSSHISSTYASGAAVIPCSYAISSKAAINSCLSIVLDWFESNF